MRKSSRTRLRGAASNLIRRARPEDLDGICAVAESVRLDPLHVQESGFLVYVLDREGYARRLATTDLFYVAVDLGEVVGFLLGYDDRTVAELVGQGVLSSDLLRARVVAGCEGRWGYADQLAVYPAYTCHGVGFSLVLALYQEVRRRGVGSAIVAIRHDPPTTRSNAFCEALGFVLRGTLRYEYGRLWGLYSRSILLYESYVVVGWYMSTPLFRWIAKRRVADMATELRRWIEVDRAGNARPRH